MSSSNFKTGLAPSGPTFADKAKATLRRPTPDSDAVASSDDEHGPITTRATNNPPAAATGRRPSTGWLQDIKPRKPSLPYGSLSSNPTTPSQEVTNPSRPGAFPWNTSSFTSSQSGIRLKEVLPSPTSADPHEPEESGINFLLNQQQPLRKSGRSQSYSIGQADIENSPLGQFSSRPPPFPVRHRPSKPSLLGESNLHQLLEDEADEVESSNGSEAGVRLSTSIWDRESDQNALRKQAAEHNARARQRAASTASPGLTAHTRRHLSQVASGIEGDYAIEEFDDFDASSGRMTDMPRRFSEFGSNPSYSGRPSHPSGGVGHIGSDVSTIIEPVGRRHSMASYPVNEFSFHPHQTALNEEDEDEMSPRQSSDSPQEPENFDPHLYFTGYGPASRAINASAISAAHPAPISTAAHSFSMPGNFGRPGRRLFVVTFKCSRADIYYTYDNTGLEIRAGDLVITEGDRGCDLGQVSHADVSLDDAKRFKAEALDEHFRWLVMFSQYSLAGAKEPGMLGALARANGFPNNMNRATLTSMGGQQEQDTKPKMIKRLAQQHEITALREKEGSEAKAKRIGAQKAVEHKLPMEILDAEFQADYHKLTFFYYADAYVNFNPLVVDIFKQYKIRIWMSAVNPASVVNPAGLMQIQPPSAIGPGAILPPRTNAPPAVGPGFGTANYRQHDQQQRGRNPASSQLPTQFDENYSPFSHQLSAYGGQQYGGQQYGQYNAQGYGGRFGGAGYAGSTAGASPMNYGAYYPPATYSASPAFNNSASVPSYRSNQAAQHSTGTGAPSAFAQPFSGYHTTSSAPAYEYDPTNLASAMANMSFGGNNSNLSTSNNGNN